MLLFPAIDIQDGQVVRLRQGDFDQVTVFSAHPVEMAHTWKDAGATWLHVVDLDGARTGRPVHTDLVLQIREATGLQVQVGGGLRTLEDIAGLFARGIDRVVLGTAAVANPALVRDLLEIWGERIVVALDARDGLVATQGWITSSDRQVVTLAAELAAAGVRRLMYTDIQRDGTLSGPNVAGLAAIQQAAGPEVGVLASGGLATLDHLMHLHAMGLEGAILGRALYTDEINLAAAIKAVQ
jgi:phosphoribosylformimino-5-aminoimidazole carboxamide ribotide isomerase